MLYWIVDNIWWPLGLLALAAVVLAFVWWVHRRQELLIALAAVSALIGLLCILSWLVITDTQRIKNALHEIADAVTDNRPDDVIPHLADQFQFFGMNRTLTKSQVRDTIKAGVGHYGVEGLSVYNIDVEELSRAAGNAKVTFNLRVFLQSDSSPKIFRCRSQFILEDGKWRMKTLEFSNPFVKTDQPLQLHVP
jgi:hypothetical protein